MEAVAKIEPREGVSLVELPDPVPGPGDVVLRPDAAAICGSDLTIRGLFGPRLWDTWTKAEAFAARHPEALNAIVTARFPLERVARAFATAASGKHGKVLFVPG